MPIGIDTWMNDNIDIRSMLPVGTLLQNGKYRIDHYLASGGFGNTYAAYNLEFEEQIAIKEFFIKGVTERNNDTISVSVSNEVNLIPFSEQKDKFKKEARRLRRLRNDHIVTVHDLFEENGTAYYVMDFIKGESLSERMNRLGRPLTEDELQPLLLQILDALETVHQQRIWHLDIKPANMMVDEEGRLRLIDFGASKQLHTADGRSVSTSSALAYTPGYAPLEQIDQNIRLFGPWTDFYALGASFYKLLTGDTPPSPSEMAMGIRLSFPAGISLRMQRLVTWMMKSRYDERPQSCQEIRVFLDADTKDDGDENTKPVEEEKPSIEDTVYIEDIKPAEQRTVQPSITTKVPEQPTRTFTNPQPRRDYTRLYDGIKGVVVGLILVVLILSVLYAMKNRQSSSIADPVKEETYYSDGDTFTSPISGGMGTYNYTGPLDGEGLPNGHGTAVLTNGDTYKGPFEHGVMQGYYGIYTYKIGDRYEGEMRNDKFYEGIYTSTDGSYFKGTFSNGQPLHGVWYDKRGKKIDEM